MKTRFFTAPNILTLCNLLCGSAAILYTISDARLDVAFVLLVVAALFDFSDGFVAKLTGSYSELGKQLDSLADVVSFGLAPTAIVYVMLSMNGAGWMAAAAGAIVAFSALRLAKFNIDENQSSEFIGMPTPANAMFFAASGYLFYNGTLVVTNPYVWIALTIFMSFMLISPVPMFALKFKSFALKENALRYSFIFLSVVALAIFQIAAIPAIVLCYIAVSVVRYLTVSDSKK